jgi:hypothetical protein
MKARHSSIHRLKQKDDQFQDSLSYKARRGQGREGGRKGKEGRKEGGREEKKERVWGHGSCGRVPN